MFPCVSTAMPASEQQKVRDALIGLREAKGGPAALETVGYKGFVPPNRDVENAVIAWLGL